MTAMSPSVDDVWKQLNSGAPKPRSKHDFDKLWLGFSSDIGRQPAKKECGKLPYEQSQTYPRRKAAQTLSAVPGAHDTGSSAPEVPALEGAALDRCIQALQAPDQRARRAALAQIKVRMRHANPLGAPTR